MGHVTCVTWHMTHDMWHMTRWGGGTYSQNFSSLALTVSDLWYHEDMDEKADILTDWMNESVTRLFIEQSQLHRVCKKKKKSMKFQTGLKCLNVINVNPGLQNKHTEA